MRDEEAVLVEPLACSVHAVRANLPPTGARVLVIGAGSIGLLTMSALSALAPERSVTVLGRHKFQLRHAERLGAAQVVRTGGDYFETLADIGGARLLKPIIGQPIGTGSGFDVTFVCVGGTSAMDDALRLTRPGGTIVLLGNVSILNGLDWTPLWLKELTVRGSVCYGAHGHGGATQDSFAESAALIGSGRTPVGPLVTHTFPLADYRQAIGTAMDRGGRESVKVAFRY
jgi:threonine dehydrogenase-like Zn-dependent dehydrogenase